MAYKILLGLNLLIIYEMIVLINDGITSHKFGFGLLKILILNTILLGLLFFKISYIEIYGKIKKAINPLIETAKKVLMTPIKSSKFK